MNFQLLRAVRETTRSGFNLTDVADELHTSQPGISRQIRELEDELGIEIFVRVGQAPDPAHATRRGGDAARRTPAARRR